MDTEIFADISLTVKARAWVDEAILGVGEPVVCDDMTYIVANQNGTISVFDNGEEVICLTRNDAIRIVVENLS